MGKGNYVSRLPACRTRKPSQSGVGDEQCCGQLDSQTSGQLIPAYNPSTAHHTHTTSFFTTTGDRNRSGSIERPRNAREGWWRCGRPRDKGRHPY
ncbi:hypothetical protein BaRGS_00029092 [Batillaria attramentaria]|uniref:Uncharacterized protein n=1 Tax=Batillaria attramentaria TaxID=370345 RepID=A0ABD0JYJ6_9CAEN